MTSTALSAPFLIPGVREVSRPSGEILSEVAGLVERGYKSITLLGQNVNSYGQDRAGAEISFAELLRAVGKLGVDGAADFWLYFTSPHPRDMSREVVQVIADYPCLAKQVHLPLQSGDDKVLIRMNRNYMVDQYRERVADHPRPAAAGHALHGHHRGLQRGNRGTVRKHPRCHAGVPVQHGLCGDVLPAARRGQLSLAGRYSPRGEEQETARAERGARKELLRIQRRMIGGTYRVLVEGPDRKPGYLSAKTEGRITVRFPSDERALIGKVRQT